MCYEQQVCRGLELLASGQVQDADQVFCAVLTHCPDHAGALHGRACVARAMGQAGLAIGFAGQAIQIKAEPHYYITLGMALYEQGHGVEGEAALKSATLLSPYDARAYHALGIVQAKLDHIESAGHALRRAVELQPDVITYWQDLAQFYWDLQAVDQALKVAQEGVKKNIGNVEFLQLLGTLLHQLNLAEEALLIFEKIVRLRPNDPVAHANLGALLFQIGKVEDAHKALSFSLEKSPDVTETQVNFALVQMAKGDLLTAKSYLERIYSVCDDDKRIGINLGSVYYELRLLNDAEAIYRNILKNKYYDDYDLEDHRACYNLSSVLLAKGNLCEGWGCMESRLYLMQALSDLNQIPVWTGDEIPKCLLVRSEQGLGDTIQFIRFLPLLLQRCAVIFEVPKSLISMMQHISKKYSLGNDFVLIEQGQLLPDHITHQCALMSLPHLLQIEHIPFFVPYLVLDQQTPTAHSRYEVGLCWAGNENYRFDRIRSASLQDFHPLLEIDQVEFHALQLPKKGDNLLDKFTHVLPAGDILSTAHYINQLDLVITVDTMIAHLAGAMGKTVWLLNRYGGDWRWYRAHHNEQGVNLWYPTVKVFQQSEVLPPNRAWERTIKTVKQMLLTKIH
ncbi:tetratricopeptide repeat protein [Commensalibacter oyaizuii]|uniref:Tetratricopeptide repeat protein n=1 Tax=Commensalibacter oyaizuii TaxID=3043873 RepID=A0ABT6PZ42_9PROT|nr:tetratricopeptide repeat protein [Commensalibacter sp. TBRC 16381]MDI2090003.1 tetratricopeptide repeat protein [Commensalibacter sp. TBRC 16381]